MQVLVSAKTLLGWLSRYFTSNLVVKSGGSDGHPVQKSTKSSNVSFLSAPSVVKRNIVSKILLFFVTQLTREVHCIHTGTTFRFWGEFVCHENTTSILFTSPCSHANQNFLSYEPLHKIIMVENHQY